MLIERLLIEKKCIRAAYEKECEFSLGNTSLSNEERNMTIEVDMLHHRCFYKPFNFDVSLNGANAHVVLLV